MHPVKSFSNSSLRFSIGSQTPKIGHSKKPTENEKFFMKSDLLIESFPKFASSINKVKHELSEAIKDLQFSNSYLLKAKNACRALEICSNEKGSYQKEMKLIVDEIKKAIFQNKNLIDEDILKRIYENHTDTVIHNSYIPYIYIAESALSLYRELKFEFFAYKSQSSDTHTGHI